MATFRGTIPDFMLANPLYVGATVSFYTVDEDGASTGVLATLYESPTGTTTLSNPQTLDSEGKNAAPIYVDVPVIASVVGPNVDSHTTGIIKARGTWRGNWVTDTVYFTNDFIHDSVTGNVYGATNDYTSDTTIDADVTAGNLVLIVDQTDILTGGGGLAIKQPCRVATTAAITLSGLQTIDGVTVAAGDRVLVKDQGSGGITNGIYNAAAGAWTRAVDCNASAKFANGCVVYVTDGTVHHNKGFQFSIGADFELDTSLVAFTAIDFPYSSIPVQFSSAPDSNLSAGVVGYVNIPFDCTIVSNTLLANASGSCVIDIKKGNYASFPPTASICSLTKPTLSAAQASQDTALTGWDTELTQGDVLSFTLDSVSGIKSVMLTLFVDRN